MEKASIKRKTERAGKSVSTLIRAVEEVCRVVIVAFSALTSGDGRRVLEAGCDGHVIKNEGINDLPGVARRHLPSA